MHGVAGDWAEAAAAALAAGVDVELPTVKTFGEPLVAALEAGEVDVALVDRALERVLRQKVELGLLDAGWDPVPGVLRDVPADVLAAVAGPGDEAAVAALRGTVDLDGPANRALAREVAEQAVVLLANDGVLPLGSDVRRVALVGPTAEDPMAVLGCYSFPAHVGLAHPEVPLGISLPTLAASLRAELPGVTLDVLPAITLDGTSDPSSTGAVSTAEVAAADAEGIAAAVDLAREADVVVVALGDRAGLFGRGTSGEGCDAESLRLPGAQQDLLDALLATGRPVVATILSGRPYALGAAATPHRGSTAPRPSSRRSSRARRGPRGRGRPVGARGAVGPAARERARDRGRPAHVLPGRDARAGDRRVEHRPDRGLRVRPRAHVHELRLVGPRGGHGRGRDRRGLRGVVRRAEHGPARRRGGRAGSTRTTPWPRSCGPCSG